MRLITILLIFILSNVITPVSLVSANDFEIYDKDGNLVPLDETGNAVSMPKDLSEEVTLDLENERALEEAAFMEEEEVLQETKKSCLEKELVEEVLNIELDPEADLCTKKTLAEYGKIVADQIFTDSSEDLVGYSFAYERHIQLYRDVKNNIDQSISVPGKEMKDVLQLIQDIIKNYEDSINALRKLNQIFHEYKTINLTVKTLDQKQTKIDSESILLGGSLYLGIKAAYLEEDRKNQSCQVYYYLKDDYGWELFGYQLIDFEKIMDQKTTLLQQSYLKIEKSQIKKYFRNPYKYHRLMAILAFGKWEDDPVSLKGIEFFKNFENNIPFVENDQVAFMSKSISLKFKRSQLKVDMPTIADGSQPVDILLFLKVPDYVQDLSSQVSIEVTSLTNGEKLNLRPDFIRNVSVKSQQPSKLQIVFSQDDPEGEYEVLLTSEVEGFDLDEQPLAEQRIITYDPSTFEDIDMHGLVKIERLHVMMNALESKVDKIKKLLNKNESFVEKENKKALNQIKVFKKKMDAFIDEKSRIAIKTVLHEQPLFELRSRKKNLTNFIYQARISGKMIIPYVQDVCQYRDQYASQAEADYKIFNQHYQNIIKAKEILTVQMSKLKENSQNIEDIYQELQNYEFQNTIDQINITPLAEQFHKLKTMAAEVDKYYRKIEERINLTKSNLNQLHQVMERADDIRDSAEAMKDDLVIKEDKALWKKIIKTYDQLLKQYSSYTDFEKQLWHEVERLRQEHIEVIASYERVEENYLEEFDEQYGERFLEGVQELRHQARMLFDDYQAFTTDIEARNDKGQECMEEALNIYQQKASVDRQLMDKDCSAQKGMIPVWDEELTQATCDCKEEDRWHEETQACIPYGKYLALTLDCDEYENSIAVYDHIQDQAFCSCRGEYEWNNERSGCRMKRSLQMNKADCSPWPGTQLFWDNKMEKPRCECPGESRWNQLLNKCHIND